MREGWKEVTLAEICDKIGDGLHGTPKYDDEGEFFFINGNNLSNGKILIQDDTKRITRKEYNKIKKELNDKTILLQINGTLGNLAYYDNEKIALGKSACYINLKEDVNKKFIRYVLEFDDFQGYAQSHATGSTIKNLGLKAIRNYKFKLPPSKIQNQIASILSAYDDLIENNLKRISILEEMAQQTFISFFSKQDSKKWKRLPLNDCIEFHIGGGWGEEIESDEFSRKAYVIRGTDMNPVSLGDVSNVPLRYHKVSNLKSRRLKDGDIIFEVSGGSSTEGVAKSLLITDELLSMFDNDIICASFCKLIRPKEEVTSHYLYFFLQYLRTQRLTEIYEKRSASNIVNYNWGAFLKYQKLIIPSDPDLKEFNDKVIPIKTSIYKLGKQNQRLREARDILLPRLMMGMIDVDNLKLERETETA